MDYIEKHFYDLIDNFHAEDPKGLILNGIGYSFLKEENHDEALKFFTLNVKLFPEDSNLWDSLGEVYYKMGDKVKALEYYEKALSIDPYMESSKEMVKLLKG